MDLQSRPGYLLRVIRDLARSTRNIHWTLHALERMDERDITDEVVIDVLRNGTCAGAIDPGRAPGEFKVKLVKEI